MIMAKNILLISLVSALLFCVPIKGYTQTVASKAVIEAQAISITVNATSMHITGANGLTLMIFDSAGIIVNQFKIDSADKHIELNLKKGCYIIKVGRIARKVDIL